MRLLARSLLILSAWVLCHAAGAMAASWGLTAHARGQSHLVAEKKGTFRPVPAPRSSTTNRQPPGRMAPLPAPPASGGRIGDPYNLCRPRCESACERVSCSGLNVAQCTRQRHTCRQGCAARC